MRDFNRNNSGKGRFFGKNSQSGNRFDRPRPTMYKAVCSNCGKDCEVPFRPNGEKPVLCRDCFRDSGKQQVGRPDERTFQKPSFQNIPLPNNEYKAQLDALTIKVDKVLEILLAATAAPKASEEVTEIAVPPTPKKIKTTKKAL